MKKTFGEKLQESKKKQFIFFLVSMFILYIGYSFFKFQMNRNFRIIEDDYSWVYQIDNFEEKNGELIVDGWAFELEQESKEKPFKIIFYNIDIGKCYYPKMIFFERKDVNNYFLCEYDYSKSGFRATISIEKLDLKNGIFQIILKPNNKVSAYKTEIYYTTL